MVANAAKGAKPAPPDDKRWKVVEATMRRHGYAPHALIETLHTVQEGYGYLDEPELRRVADALHVPLSRVYGVATFYHLFTLKPQGEHSCVVCTGTACYIKGIPAILEAVDAAFGVKPGETTKDGKLSLLTARCIGACGLAPAAVFDGNVGGRLTPEESVQRLRALVASERAEKEAAHDA
ncbi:MAG TPA: bidirectional hydrogenase complex protein HoxE [Deinococcales bacterium]|nr:bidirectional hydrogenase complex protein HoxE [Deinococcales bacterium]